MHDGFNMSGVFRCVLYGLSEILHHAILEPVVTSKALLKGKNVWSTAEQRAAMSTEVEWRDIEITVEREKITEKSTVA